DQGRGRVPFKNRQQFKPQTSSHCVKRLTALATQQPFALCASQTEGHVTHRAARGELDCVIKEDNQLEPSAILQLSAEEQCPDEMNTVIKLQQCFTAAETGDNNKQKSQCTSLN
ncbi:hypothetical protein ATANTOWER_025854, partial [Ataeniobius toweri]|nr:hypothetical protein [Ataeniobius toweri]